MPEFQIDMRDVRFILFDLFRIQDVFRDAPKYADQGRDLYDAVITEAERLTTTLLAPLNQEGDRIGARFEDGKVILPPGFKEAYGQYAGGGWIGMLGGPEWGGMGLPLTVGAAVSDISVAGCVSLLFTAGLTSGAAHLIEAVGTDEQKKTYLEKLYSGAWAATMCLTEAQAGSYVGDARTVAVPQEDGSYLVTGNKMFITSGDHDLTDQIVHLVLARTPDAPAGTRGISLFIVPKYLFDERAKLTDFNDVHCVGIEEKMGIHGSPTCQLSFGDNGSCRGWIIGQEGDGLRHMFRMMNEARIAVGLQGSGLANAAFQLALAYSKERIQGTAIEDFKKADAPRVAIINHPNVRNMLMEAKSLSEGIRGICLKAAFYSDLALGAAPEADRARYESYGEILTPIVKAYGSDMALRVTDLAIQVHGGYGYIKEYGVEQHMRDVKIASIYEGTNSIQALDLIGRKVARRGGQDFMALVSEIDRFIREHKEHEVLSKELARLGKAKDLLIEMTMTFGGHKMQGDMAYPVLLCKQYLEMFGHVVTCWTLLEQAVLAHEKAQAIHQSDPDRSAEDHPELKYLEGKVHTAKFFTWQILPAVHGLAERIRSKDRSALEIVL